MRQNYHEESEAGVNAQISKEMHANYAYLSMAHYYDRGDVALPNFAEYFRAHARRKLDRAMKLMKFQNDRGGKLKLDDVKPPVKEEWGTGIDGMVAALEIEKGLNTALLALQGVADKHADRQMADFISGNFLAEQIKLSKELSNHMTNLNRVGKIGHGEYHFDSDSLP